MDPQTLETVLHYFLGGVLGAAGMVCTTWFIVAALQRRTMRRGQQDAADRLERIEAALEWLTTRVADAELREQARVPLLPESTRPASTHRTPH